mmetsp:Transcript_35707/g.47105  ORF Transcript_35707/g.47105 Transcript_35707/m.47105 type:complete len:118 (+) Transcript_35707:307-660(+)
MYVSYIFYKQIKSSNTFSQYNHQKSKATPKPAVSIDTLNPRNKLSFLESMLAFKSSTEILAHSPVCSQLLSTKIILHSVSGHDCASLLNSTTVAVFKELSRRSSVFDFVAISAMTTL